MAVWKKIGFTAYTVQQNKHTYDIDPGHIATYQGLGEPYTMMSPNKNNVGARFYCVDDYRYVRTIGFQYIDYNEPVGDPIVKTRIAISMGPFLVSHSLQIFIGEQKRW